MLTAVTTKNANFWVVIACSLETARRFGGTYSLLLRGRRISWRPASAGYMFSLHVLFNPEEGDYMILRNVGLFLGPTTVQPFLKTLLSIFTLPSESESN
jgi:hypothetical protein